MKKESKAKRFYSFKFQQKINELWQGISQILEQKSSFQIKDLAANGKDLAEIGIPKGPQMGIILNELLETVFDDPDQNQKDQLLAIAR